MRIVGIETGVDFEKIMIRTLRDAGMVVHDTPASNDYGADLIIEYRGLQIAGQCKYYSNPVSVKAIQEVIGAIGYYNCDAGVVFTNNVFTQQAINLASSNGILLIDGDTLEKYFNDFSLFGVAFSHLFRTNDRANQSQTQQKTQEEWTINDLLARYGVSNQTIIKNFLGYGLPYSKVGREYRFDPHKVFLWEVDTHYVPFGRKGKYELPGYEQYRKSMNAQIKEAKLKGDTDAVKRKKKEMRAHKVSRFSEKTKDNLIVIIIFFFLIIGWFISKKYKLF